MKFFSSALALALVAVVVSADIAAVKQDIKDIDAGVNGLRDAFPANPDSISYFSALDINTKANNLDAVIKRSTVDVTALTETISEADAQEVIDSLTATEVNVKTTVSKLIGAKPRFDKLGVTSLAKKDIEDLAADTKLFGNALVAKAPATKTASASALLDQFNADLAAGVAAYQ